MGVDGPDKRENDSSSFYNLTEIDRVVSLVESLLAERSAQGIRPADISVISPFRTQVKKLRLLLRDHGLSNVSGMGGERAGQDEGRGAGLTSNNGRGAGLTSNNGRGAGLTSNNGRGAGLTSNNGWGMGLTVGMDGLPGACSWHGRGLPRTGEQVRHHQHRALPSPLDQL